ncbi:zf-HC2 domain-containing protein [Streptomyces sp. NPDC051940]|uniref:zf-HC2 domain-containing protein n=1 Tax=Streptomyces sp. NPDC051940 TaxID=3155675 RepID=UPI003440CA8F
MSWHVTPELAGRYAAGEAADADAWSVEKHVESCTECASAVSAAVAAGPAGARLAAVREAVLRDAVGVSGGAHRAACPAGAARGRDASRFRLTATARLAWAAGPALSRPWSAAVLLVAALAVAAARLTGYDGARDWLLVLAPVLPLLGVAVSYGPHADPLHELTAATPAGGLRLLLVRTAVVLAASVPLVAVTGLLLPAPPPGSPGAAVWLLPCLGLCLCALALGGFLGCRSSCTVLGGGWLAVTLTPRGAAAPAPAAVLEALAAAPGAQAAWAAVGLGSAGLLAARRTAYDRPRF